MAQLLHVAVSQVRISGHFVLNKMAYEILISNIIFRFHPKEKLSFKFTSSSRRNPYDNTEEFWVETRTTGLSAFEVTHTERETQIKQSLSAVSWLQYS